MQRENVKQRSGFVLGASVVLGIGLIVLWLVGLGQGSAGWLLWMDLLAGIVSIGAGVAASEERAPRWSRIGEPVALGVATAILWIIALARGVESWKTWWTFAFACAYFVVGIATGVEQRERGVSMRDRTPRAV